MPASNPLKTFAIEKILRMCVHFPSRQGLSPFVLRRMMDKAGFFFPVDKRLAFRQLELAGMQCEEIRHKRDPATQLIFHIHGGAFFLGGLDSHRGLMCDLVRATGAQVIHLNYPLAPEQVFPSALNTLQAAYLEALEQGIAPKNITLSGDSCGGNLALALCLKLRDENLPLPNGLILLSPWLDLSLSGASIRRNAKHDALLSEQLLRDGVKYYLNDNASVDEPYVSPLFANLKGLPEILIHVGSKEILLDDAKRFKKAADRADVDCTLTIYSGMWHNFHMFNHWITPAKKALKDITKFVDRMDR